MKDFDALNKNAGIPDPFTPKKKVKFDEIIDYLFKHGEARMDEIAEAVYGFNNQNLAWKSAKVNVNGRLNYQNAATHIHGTVEKVEGKKGTWRLTAAKRAAIEKQNAALKTLDKPVEVPKAVIAK